MRGLLAVLIVLIFAATAPAIEIAGVHVEPSVTVDHHVLKHNGSGIRKKFFVKVYVGSLYSANHLTTAAQALQDTGDKVIRMTFLYSRVTKDKITEAFQEGFAKNTPQLADSAEVRKFLALFTNDFRRGDVVDLVLGGDGTVTVKQNGRLLGTLTSRPLNVAILAIYLGEHPADEELKRGMLGRP